MGMFPLCIHYPRTLGLRCHHCQGDNVSASLDQIRNHNYFEQKALLYKHSNHWFELQQVLFHRIYLNLKKDNYFLLTIHRSENVDKKQRLKNILKGLKLVYKKFQLPIIFPIHPRTKKMMNSFKLRIPEGVKIIEPVGYLDFLKIEANARLILTDSGGIQEESCLLRVPCVTLRDNTERPETIEIKSNVLSGTNHFRILKHASKMLNKKRNWENPFGKKGVAKKIIES